jgi:hypothetical protein
VVAYDSPNGNVIGGIEPGRAYQVLDLPADLVDLQPQIAPAVVYVSVSPPAPAYAAPVVEAAPTPAEQQYQAASARQQNIQNRLIEIPTLAPMEQNAVTVNWAAEQYRSERPEVGR